MRILLVTTCMLATAGSTSVWAQDLAPPAPMGDAPPPRDAAPADDDAAPDDDERAPGADVPSEEVGATEEPRGSASGDVGAAADDDVKSGASATDADASETGVADFAKSDDAKSDDASAETSDDAKSVAKIDGEKNEDEKQNDGEGEGEEDAGQIFLDDTIERFRRPTDRLLEQTLGSTSRPVGFDWRDTLFHLAIAGSELIERNNFGSFRAGVMGRKAFGDILVDVAVNYVWVLTTDSSRLLALTPYIQSGRPSRWEVDVDVSYPLAEGVVTPLFDVLPPMELVLSASAGVRYLLYPRAVVGSRDWGDINTWTNTTTWTEVGTSLASPQLSEADQLVLAREVPGGMRLDLARLQTLVGMTFDVYMQPGLFVSTRVLIAVPVLTAVTASQLSFWPEITIALGYAF